MLSTYGFTERTRETKDIRHSPMAQKWLGLGDIAQNKLTPMLRQYLEAKAECSDSLLFFRMGDFYEMFFEDAIESAEILGLTLTSRDGADKDARIPMAGVPVRTLDTYVAKLIQAGRTVTIKIKYADFRQITRSKSKADYVADIATFTALAHELLDGVLPLEHGVRLVGLSLSTLTARQGVETGDRHDLPSQRAFDFT